MKRVRESEPAVNDRRTDVRCPLIFRLTEQAIGRERERERERTTPVEHTADTSFISGSLPRR